MFKKFLISTASFISLTCSASAYYQKTDWNESIYVTPNQTVFLIPDTGDNLNSQTKFWSKDYLDKARIPAKSVEIKHRKLVNSGVFSDTYVPSARAIIVDRSLYNREWVAGSGKGTSNRDESMVCQSAEGINISFGINIAASITEEDAPTYLYVHGIITPMNDKNDPEITFQSVYFARKLPEVMDSIGRGRVHSIVCNKMAQHGLIELNKNLNHIMEETEKETIEFFKHSGITIQYVGLADTLSFDPAVQKSINEAFNAQQHALALRAMEPVLPVMQAKAVNEAIADISKKWDGKIPQLPSVFFNSSDITNAASALSHLFKNSGVPTLPVPTGK